jgi:hypothetical protein
MSISLGELQRVVECFDIYIDEIIDKIWLSVILSSIHWKDEMYYQQFIYQQYINNIY